MSSAIVMLIAVVLVVVALAVAGWLAIHRRRALQNRFGAEYDQVLAHQPSRAAAEQELRGRERKHAQLQDEIGQQLRLRLLPLDARSAPLGGSLRLRRLTICRR